jgi:hypothetical protein
LVALDTPARRFPRAAHRARAPGGALVRVSLGCGAFLMLMDLLTMLFSHSAALSSLSMGFPH